MEEKKENNFLVVKHNSLINFKTKTSYTLNQFKMVCFLVSHIKPECKNRSKPDNDARVRPDAKTEFNRTVKRCSTGH